MFAHIARTIGVVTDTFYPKFGVDDSETTRGNLALSLVESAKRQRLTTIVVDGGSAPAFIEALEKIGVPAVTQKEKGMSRGRQQGYAALFEKREIEICIRTEPEKVSFIEDKCFEECIQPILECTYSVVIPSRSGESLKTYPPFQAQSETLANAIYCDVLDTYGLSVPGFHIDAFFGPRIFHRSAFPCFMKRHLYRPEHTSPANSIINPGAYSDALYYPIVSRLMKLSPSMSTAPKKTSPCAS